MPFWSRRADRGASRVLFLHTGIHKTGSTALQVYLARNQARLAAGGVSYAQEPGAIESYGNLQPFVERTEHQPPTDDEVRTGIEFLLGGRSRGIGSSEDLVGWSSERWQQLVRVAAAAKVEVRSITFVRDIAPYYLSLFRQLARAGLNKTFDVFCEGDSWRRPRVHLRALLDTLGRGAMTVIHYESVADRIDAAFLAPLGLKPGSFDRSALEQTINRSMTDYEQELLVRVNAITGARHSAALAETFTRLHPHLTAKQHFEPSLVASLAARHRADLDWVNQTFFGGSPLLAITPPNSPPTASDGVTGEVRQRIDAAVMDLLFAQLQTGVSETYAFLRRELANLDWSKAGDPRLPSDFDPVAYLILNHDVLQARYCPFQHYLDHGHRDGRKYRWPNRP